MVLCCTDDDAQTCYTESHWSAFFSTYFIIHGIKNAASVNARHLNVFIWIDFVNKLLLIYISHDCLQPEAWFSQREREKNNTPNISNKETYPVWFTILIFIIFIEDGICTSCLSFRFKHSADSDACRRKFKWKRKGRGDHNQKYVQRSEYVQALTTSSSE